MSDAAMTNRCAIIAAVALLLGLTAMAQTPKGQMVDFSGNSGYLATPSGGGRHAGIVVIQEWWGLNDWIKLQADKLAQQGYVALAPDLFHGKVATTPDEAMKLVGAFNRDQGIAELKAAYDYLNQRSDVRHDDIGVIGWCFGGGLSAALAENEPQLKACVIYYGQVPTDAETAGKIQAPVLGNFGGADKSIPPDKVRQFESAMRAQSKSVDIKIYDNMPHAFAGSHTSVPGHEQAAADAWRRTTEFLAAHLRS
jgi:carboxymethylenebutenolidase